jgi:hypothetical protein
MLTIKAEGFDDLLRQLDGMKRQIPYAIANGINRTAQRVLEAEKSEVQSVFKSPTPFTVNSVRIWRRKWPNSEVAVYFKDPPNLSQKDHYLLPQVEGGDRPLKPYEMGLGGRFTTPAKGLKLDQYGNLGRGQLTKIMSQSGSFRKIFDMNRTRKGNRTGDMMMLREKRGKLLPGIYERFTTGAQAFSAHMASVGKKNQSAALRKALRGMSPRGIRPVLIFPGKAPTYKKRFDFYGVAHRVVDQHLRADMSAAIDAEIQRELAYRASRGR